MVTTSASVRAGASRRGGASTRRECDCRTPIYNKLEPCPLCLWKGVARERGSDPNSVPCLASTRGPRGRLGLLTPARGAPPEPSEIRIEGGYHRAVIQGGTWPPFLLGIENNNTFSGAGGLTLFPVPPELPSRARPPGPRSGLIAPCPAPIAAYDDGYSLYREKGV